MTDEPGHRPPALNEISMPPPVRTPGKARLVWAIIACGLSLVSVVVELTTRICSDAFFNPLPDRLSTASYIFVALMLLVNEKVIRGIESTAIPPPLHKRVLLAAILASGAALAVSLAFTAIFVPILPVSVLGILVFGAGLCAWSPLLNLLVLFAQFRALLARWSRLRLGSTPLALAGATVCAAAALVILVGRPLALGYTAEAAIVARGTREPYVSRLRTLGGEAVILNLCYQDKSLPVWVSLGRDLYGPGKTAFDETPESVRQARQVYYLMTGRPYQTGDPSLIASKSTWWGRWERDEVLETGGDLVGSAVKGLSLSSSRIDGVLDPRSETSYCEWTIVFRNASEAPQEARAEILLPPGGVVDKVSLWIEGEERPAAFGPRSVVRKAYQEVAVREQRDPLLVTAREPGHVMAQCFPVPAGGEMKIRLGMSAPLIWRDPASPRLCFSAPSLQEVNFKLPGELRHHVWMEGHWETGRGRLAGAQWTLTQGPAPEGKDPASITHTARLQLPAASLLSPPLLSIEGGRAPAPGDVPSAELVRRRSPFEPARSPLELIVVVDTSDGLRKEITLPALAARCAALPGGSRVRLVDSRLEPGQAGAATEWVDAQRVRDLDGWWRQRQFVGGVEPTTALGWAWEEARTSRGRSAILWLHGPTPPGSADASVLLGYYERRPDGPPLVGVRLGTGPDTFMDDLAGQPRVYALVQRPGTDAVDDGVRLAALASSPPAGAGGTPLGGRWPPINGVYVATPVGTAKTAAATGSARPAGSSAQRLAAYSHALAAWYSARGQGADRKPAIKAARALAISRRLVTPLSGAVVLEAKEQYDRFNLDGKAPDEGIPSVPEPGVTAMLVLGILLFGAAGLRRKWLASRAWSR